jgi:hypothetical protein
MGYMAWGSDGPTAPRMGSLRSGAGASYASWLWSVYEGTSTTLPPPNESVSMSAYEWCEFKPLTSVQRKKGHRFPSPLTIEQRSVREQVARLCFKMHVCMPLLDTLTHLPLLFCSNGSRNTPPRVDIRNTTLSVMKAACSLKVQASWTTNE